MSTFVSNGSWGNGLSAIDELLKSCADSKKEHLTKEFRCNVILRKQFVTWWKKYLYMLKAFFFGWSEINYFFLLSIVLHNCALTSLKRSLSIEACTYKNDSSYGLNIFCYFLICSHKSSSNILIIWICKTHVVKCQTKNRYLEWWLTRMEKRTPALALQVPLASIQPIFDLKSQNWLLECKTLGNIIAVFMNHQAICEWIIKRSGDGAEKMDSRILLDFRFHLIGYSRFYLWIYEANWLYPFYFLISGNDAWGSINNIVKRLRCKNSEIEAFGDIIDLLTYCLKSEESMSSTYANFHK